MIRTATGSLLEAGGALDRTWAWVRLLRLTNALPAALLVLVGARRLGADPLPAPVWVAAAAMLCITTFGYVDNDVVDAAEDHINKPDRPLPSGRVTARQARLLAGALAAGGLAWAATISLPALAVAGATLSLLALYNRRFKATPGPGNLLVGLLAGGTLLTGGVAAYGWALPELVPLLPSTATLAAFVTAREVLKTLEDLPGDRAVGKATLAVRRGVMAAYATFAALAGATVLLALLPLRWLGYSYAYAVVMGLGVCLPLLAAAIDLARHASPPRVRRWLVALKAGYLAGIVALLLA
jgi:geranylgeranylglycerol-phosphate geranylgeranyltransferase